ncbi:MAG: hypothetical protein RSB39_03380 [Oscillospiraceae bacterium]
MSDMYKSCPEHPIIEEMLRNGAPYSEESALFCLDGVEDILEYLQVMAGAFISDKDFERICHQRNLRGLEKKLK